MPVHLPEVGGVEAVVAGMMKHLLHPRRGGGKEPWGQALWCLLLLPLPDSGASFSAMAGPHEGAIMTQGDGGSFKRTCCSVNMVKGLMHLFSSLTYSANWCGSLSCRGLAALAQCCRAVA